MGETSKIGSLWAASPARDTEKTWDDCLAEFSSLLLQVVPLFERDPDQVEDWFLFVCERLRRDKLRRLRRFRSEGTASFAT